MRKQRVVLEHQANAAALRGHEDTRRAQGLAVNRDAPGVRRLEPGDQPQQRGLAATGMAKQADDLAGGGLPGDLIDRDRGAIAASQAVDGQRCGARGGRIGDGESERGGDGHADLDRMGGRPLPAGRCPLLQSGGRTAAGRIVPDKRSHLPARARRAAPGLTVRRSQEYSGRP
jgi:hypothetical protein